MVKTDCLQANFPQKSNCDNGLFSGFSRIFHAPTGALF
jgi:hypothetical protein